MTSCELACGKQKMKCPPQVYTQTCLWLLVCAPQLNRSDFDLLDLHIGDARLNVTFLLTLQVMYLHKSSFHRCLLVPLCQQVILASSPNQVKQLCMRVYHINWKSFISADQQLETLSLNFSWKITVLKLKSSSYSQEWWLSWYIWCFKVKQIGFLKLNYGFLLLPNGPWV